MNIERDVHVAGVLLWGEHVDDNRLGQEGSVIKLDLLVWVWFFCFELSTDCLLGYAIFMPNSF